MSSVIRVENLSKKYIIDHQKQERYTTLRDVLANGVKRRLGKLLHPSARQKDAEHEEFWALKEVSFDIQQGDRVGIISRNGAGKSTLLKVLSRITEPTSGRVSIKGRVASLLEVGTGFHPELTGRENIFLNGAILGMSKAEIKNKFDEIVSFAEVEKFLDTPVKRYSSGMYVRLAFAVAAHLEPEILIVDEVLAVGDAGFQNKCFKKMGEFGGRGVTVLVVSHNISVITRLCNRGIILQSGRLDFDGTVLDAVNRYSEIASGDIRPYKIWAEPAAPGNEVVRLLSIKAYSVANEQGDVFDIRRPVTIEFSYRVCQSGKTINPAFFLYNQDNIIVFISGGMHDPEWAGRQRQAGLYTSRCIIPGNFLAEGTYSIQAIINTMDNIKSPTVHVNEKDTIGFKIYDPLEGGSARGEHRGAYYGVVRPILEWDIGLAFFSTQARKTMTTTINYPQSTNTFFKGKKVFLAGHTGFKGGWLSLWLQSMGAEVHGYALNPPTETNIFSVAEVNKGMASSVIADIRDAGKLSQAMKSAGPEIIFHMAAQPLVRYSYAHPAETYEVNVMGTVNLFEAVRTMSGVKAVVNVTSDKCYENHEWERGYRENEAMGGFDPYSSSKGCAELVTAAYRRSFLDPAGIALASARAGNVIGGGDWAADRLIPDLLRAMDAGETLKVRSPDSIRPWQHVLEPLSGYLMLAEQLYSDGASFAEAWNFGPADEDARPVKWIVERMAEMRKDVKWQCDETPQPHEANYLKLDSSKAHRLLNWQPRWRLQTALQKTLEWHGAWRKDEDMRAVTLAQIAAYQPEKQNS